MGKQLSIEPTGVRYGEPITVRHQGGAHVLATYEGTQHGFARLRFGLAGVRNCYLWGHRAGAFRGHPMACWRVDSGTLERLRVTPGQAN